MLIAFTSLSILLPGPYVYDASSIYSLTYNAEQAANTGGGYYCSKKNVLPVHWWRQFEGPVIIKSISFDEVYEGSTFEFWGCNGQVQISNNFACSGQKRTLITGSREDLIAGSSLSNALFNVYGLTANKLGSEGYMSLKNFIFRTGTPKNRATI